MQGYLTGGKDGVVTLWDEAFTDKIKSYSLEQSRVIDGSVFHTELPPVRSLSLGQDCILVGTKNSEVCVYVGVFKSCLCVCLVLCICR